MNGTLRAPRISGVVGLIALMPAVAVAQQDLRGARDSLRLPALQEAALRTDPRVRQLDLLAGQSRLRLRSITAERLPVLSAEGQAQYQSDVVRIPFELPNGQRIPSPGRDTYDAHVGAQQSLFDPTLGARRTAERAQLAESQSRVRTALFGLRREVNDAFFAAASLQASLAELDATMTDLEARRREAVIRVLEGTALPSDSAALAATLLQRRQDEAAVRANRRAALARLEVLTGQRFPEEAPLALPDLAERMAEARRTLADLRARPEYEQFARTRERLGRQAEVTAARELPRLSAFGQLGYGRPGLNVLNDDFDSYWLVGVQLQWTPWTWGTVRRERETLALEQQIVAAEEAAFRDGLRRVVEGDLATIDQVTAALATDERIIALREVIERESRLRFQEGAITAAEYVDRSSDLLDARLARARHRVELAQARAQFLTTVGIAPASEER
ncbi:MAG: TolC family protein [Gemmatimonadaceae bacterium]